MEVMRPVRLRYTAQAREHIAAIYSYIRDRNPVAATQVAARIRLAAERLVNSHASDMPVALPARMSGWCAILPYIIVYQTGAVDSDEVLILGVFHAAQDREPE